jgi:ABC-type sugar transport system substrate-binding protein
MRRHGTTLVSVFIFVGAALIAACAKPYHEENERYVFVATNINLPYWQEAEAGFLDAAKVLGVRGELIGPTAYERGTRNVPPDRGTAPRRNLPLRSAA